MVHGSAFMPLFSLWKNKTWRGFFLFWLLGLAGGIFVFLLGETGKESQLLAESQVFFYTLQSQPVSGEELFYYIFRKRFLAALILWGAGMTAFGAPVLFGAVFGYALTASYMVCVLTCLYGARGFPIALAAGFPQNLIYLPTWLVLFTAASRKSRKYHTLLLICLLLAFASFLESWVNPVILLNIGKLMNLF